MTRTKSRRPFIDFDFIKKNATFPPVLEHYGIVPKGRRGADEFLIRCPFHEDREPSCSISLPKGAWHCFGCERHGNVLEFVADMEKLDRKGSLREAAGKLAALCGIALGPSREARRRGATEPQDGPGTTKTDVRPPQGAKPPSRAVYEAREPSLERNPLRPYGLKFVDPAHAYLAARGLAPDAAEKLEVGFYGGTGSMRGRITLAIRDWWPDPDEPSRLVAFVGRLLTDPPPDDEPRWKFPEGFKKSQVLYNLHRIAGARHVHLVEGFFDAIRLHLMDIPAVALMGRSISPEQIELLRRSGCRAATVLMDGDDEGRAAAPIVLEAVGRRGLFARILDLPEGEDPASATDAALRALLRVDRS